MITRAKLRRPSCGTSRTLLGPTILLLLGVATLLGGRALDAQGEPDPYAPEAARILDRFVEVTGGREAYEALETRVSRGTQRLEEMGMTGIYSAWETDSALRRTLFESEMLGEMHEGSSEAFAWAMTTAGGPRVKRGDELAQALRQAPIDAPIRWRDDYARAEPAGEGTIDEAVCDLVRLTTPDGRVETRAFERDSGLLRHVDLVVDTEGGPIGGSLEFGDYLAVGDVLVPHRIVTAQGKMERITVLLETVSHSEAIDAAVFELPEEIAAIRSRRK